MTPKEKAEELIKKFYDTQLEVLSKDDTAPLDSIEHEISGKSALIAVDEILKIVSSDESAIIVELQYWQQVHKEIENL